MMRRIGIWALCGFGVAAVWVILSFFLPRGSYNFGRSNLVAITAPAAMLGRSHSIAMKYYTFIALNAGMYALVGAGAEMFRKRQP
jgi:hypothetical protein